jgi:bifunctional non-homologous end joining protein LigD
MNTTQAESVTLYFKEQNSDKVYTTALEPSGAGWVVRFAYGRRGSTMQTGTKTLSPVPFDKAKSIFDKLVAEKTAKGYTPGEDGAVYTHTSNEARDTGERPQLLNDVDESEIEALINDPAWGMQEKKDGRRMLVKKTGRDVAGINRKGLAVGLPDTVVAALRAKFLSFASGLIDGEAVGDTLFAFDLLDDGGDIRKLGYSERHRTLRGIDFNSAIQVVPLAVTAKDKRALLEKVRKAEGEGVVFKRLDAPYKAGRPNSGGDQLKFKFYATGSFIVSKVNDKRSVALEVLVKGKRVPIGNVTIPPNKEVPGVGAVVEVRYLYCFRGGSLYQPTFLAQRDDIDIEECVESQLKYKSEEI